MISSSNLLAAFACAIAAASASTLNTRQTSHNAIYTPGLNELVPVGVPYKITWKADVPGLVNIYLLRGPTENLKVLFPIVEGIDNTGSYDWTPPTTLEDDKTHYGLNLTMPGVPGEFQYSTQFGIKNKQPGSGGGSGTGIGTGSTSATTGVTSIIASGSVSTTVTNIATTDVTVTTSTGSSGPTSIAATGAPFANGTITSTGKPAGSTATPSTSAKGNRTTSAKPSSGAVGQVGGGLGAVFMAFGAALMI